MARAKQNIKRTEAEIVNCLGTIICCSPNTENRSIVLYARNYQSIEEAQWDISSQLTSEIILSQLTMFDNAVIGCSIVRQKSQMSET